MGVRMSQWTIHCKNVHQIVSKENIWFDLDKLSEMVQSLYLLVCVARVKVKDITSKLYLFAKRR